VLREDAALIARVYAADYARFGYSLPDLAPTPPMPCLPARRHRQAIRRALCPPPAQAYSRI
jgi:hypothetical protein